MREIIFEAFYGGKWWRKLLCRVFCHTWSKIFDTQIGLPRHGITMIMWQCVNCKVKQLWIGKEFTVSPKRREGGEE